MSCFYYYICNDKKIFLIFFIQKEQKIMIFLLIKHNIFIFLITKKYIDIFDNIIV